MNRLGLGLAVGAGYVLGRTKKMKLAFAVGTMVAGKRMQLSPRALMGLVNQQLQNNPQFKEIGDQLREDLRGVGKAASGALVERQIEGIADRLHGRTAQVRDQVSGVVPDEVPDVPGLGKRKSDERERYEEEDEGTDELSGSDEEFDDSEEREEPADDESRESGPPRKKAAAKKTAAKKTSERQAPAKKAAAKKTAGRTAKKAPAKKTAAAKSSARRARTSLPKGGRDSD